jgi:hypothetical protein
MLIFHVENILGIELELELELKLEGNRSILLFDLTIIAGFSYPDTLSVENNKDIIVNGGAICKEITLRFSKRLKIISFIVICIVILSLLTILL